MDKWIGYSRRAWGIIMVMLPALLQFGVEAGWMTLDPNEFVSILDGIWGNLIGIAGGVALLLSMFRPDPADVVMKVVPTRENITPLALRRKE